LLRGDIASRYAAYQIGRQNGWINADEIRELENMNPIGGEVGSAYIWPANMMPAEIALNPPEPAPAPVLPPPAESETNEDDETDDER